MENEKIENQLNLALDLPEEEREKSESLSTGFDAAEDTWEVILRIEGEVENLRQGFPEADFTLLTGGYVIAVVPASQVEALAMQREVLYMEKPKRLYLAVENGRRVSCINTVQSTTAGAGVGNSLNLTGLGVLVACIDSGIDYRHPDFRRADGTTRIAWLWDQSLRPRAERSEEAPAGFTSGTEFSAAVINEALAQPTEQEQYAVCPSRDLSGHGTHVAGIAAGNGRASQGRYRGVAYEASLIVVKLGNQSDRGFPRTTQLMEALEYCIRKAVEMAMPIAVNISFGNNYGSHAGNSLLETYIDVMALEWKNNIVVGSGNEGASGVHTSGEFTGEARVELTVGALETGLNVQLWKLYHEDMEITVMAPDGTRLGPLVQELSAQQFVWEGTTLYVYYGTPSPYSPYQEIYFDFLPRGNGSYVDSGIWTFLLESRQGSYEMWLPAGGTLNRDTGFLTPTENITLTIPSTAQRAITVGAYDGRTRQYASFSGRGYTWQTDSVKPDLAAPGVDVISCAPGGGYTAKSGTSMATPFVTGSAALLMQWGIVDGNDPYLYGEKLRAYLIRGARPILGEPVPSPKTGWGALCVRDSLPW